VKGIIFNLLQEVVEEDHGETTWDALLAAAGVDGSYTSLGSYPDTEFVGLVHAASDALQRPFDEVVRWAGERAMPLLAARYPEFFEGHASVQPFLATLNGIIHPEVRKIYPGAVVPDFDFDMTGPDVLVLGYRSERRLCALAEGFIIGAAAHFGQAVGLDQPSCMLHGDERCLIRCTFTAPVPKEPDGHDR
jgi:hypothetical protein